MEKEEHREAIVDSVEGGLAPEEINTEDLANEVTSETATKMWEAVDKFLTEFYLSVI